MAVVADAVERAPRQGRWRRELLTFAELFAVCGLAVAQPFYDVAAKNIEVFSTRRTSPGQLVALSLLVLLVPPIALAAVELLVALAAPRARAVAHALLLGVPVFVYGVEVLKHGTDLGEMPLVALGVLAALVVALLVWRSQTFRAFLRLLAIAPLLFLVWFLALSPIEPVVFGPGAAPVADVAIRHPHRVVWIVFDEFPLTSLLDGSGAVDRALYPNFAALSDTATWYRNSATVAPFTLAAVPAMLTGRLPTDTNKPALITNYPRNLFTLLGGTYGVNAHETLTVMCPTTVCADRAHGGTADRSFGSLFDTTTGLWRDYASPRRKPPGLEITRGVLNFDADPLGTARRFVASLRPSTRPRLDFLHVLLPHWPWHYRANLQDDGNAETPPGLASDRWESAWVATSAREQHLLQVQATDSVLGLIRQRLQRIGAWDDSLVVVTADHGVGFDAHEPARGLSTAAVPDVVWTPLFVKYPGQARGVVDDRPARTIDILPTVADALGLRLPWKVAGRSLLGPVHPDPNVEVFSWPIDDMKPAPGSKFNVVRRAPGFATALTERAAAPGDPAWRLYRTGPYGDLVGTRAAARIDPTRSGVKARITDAAKFDAVDPRAPVAPWLWISGASFSARETPIAIAVNGVIGAVTQSVATPHGSLTAWWAPLPTQLFHAGRNVITLYEIRGQGANVRLHPMATA